MNIVLGYLITYLYVALVLMVAYIFKAKFHCKTEFTRKIIHIFPVLSWFIMVPAFSNTWHLVVIPTTIVILNYISYKKKLFTMMEREDASQNTPGAVYYAVSWVVLSICSILDSRFLIPYGIGIFCMAFGDGLAPFFGRRWKSITFKLGNFERTLLGSFSVFLICLMVVLIFNTSYHLDITGLQMIGIALAGSLFEFVGIKGIDNLTLPIGVATLSYLCIIF